VVGDDPQPGIEAPGTAEAGKGPVGPDQGLLGGLVGVEGIAQAAVTGAPEAGVVAPVELGEGSLGARLEAFDEGRVTLDVDVGGPGGHAAFVLPLSAYSWVSSPLRARIPWARPVRNRRSRR